MIKRTRVPDWSIGVMVLLGFVGLLTVESIKNAGAYEAQRRFEGCYLPSLASNSVPQAGPRQEGLN